MGSFNKTCSLGDTLTQSSSQPNLPPSKLLRSLHFAYFSCLQHVNFKDKMFTCWLIRSTHWQDAIRSRQSMLFPSSLSSYNVEAHRCTLCVPLLLCPFILIHGTSSRMELLWPVCVLWPPAIFWISLLHHKSVSVWHNFIWAYRAYCHAVYPIESKNVNRYFHFGKKNTN